MFPLHRMSLLFYKMFIDYTDFDLKMIKNFKCLFLPIAHTALPSLHMRRSSCLFCKKKLALKLIVIVKTCMKVKLGSIYGNKTSQHHFNVRSVCKALEQISKKKNCQFIMPLA